MKLLLIIFLFGSTAFSAEGVLNLGSFSQLNTTLTVLSENLSEDINFEYVEGKPARRSLKDLRCEVRKKPSVEVFLYFVNLIYNASMYLPDETLEELDLEKTNLEFEELINNRKVKYCYFNGMNFDSIEYLYIRHSEMEFAIKLSEINRSFL